MSFMRVIFMADDCLQRTLCSDSTLFSPLYRGILILSSSLCIQTCALWDHSPFGQMSLHLTTTTTESIFKLSDILWGWNWIVDQNYEAILKELERGDRILWWFRRKLNAIQTVIRRAFVAFHFHRPRKTKDRNECLMRFAH